MSTTLKSLYRSLKLFSLECQEGICADLIRSKRLAKCFHEALAANSLSFDNRKQRFLEQATIDGRAGINVDDNNENRAIAVMEGIGLVRVVDGPGDYEFSYVQRQVPPFRMAGVGDPHSGAGGIDYIGRKGSTPILGEVKRKGDQNAFYAFVQLLSYLSQMATPKQVERANRHGEFGVSIGDRPSFDLHILLADRNPRSAKERLIEPTKKLAAALQRDLLSLYPESSSVIGSIFCLEMDTDQTIQTPEMGVHCHWVV